MSLSPSFTVTYGSDVLASALAMMGQNLDAARLFGATEALRERTRSVVPIAPVRELRERHLAALRAHLGADELAAAWAEGRAMTIEEAVEYALETNVAPPPNRQ